MQINRSDKPNYYKVRNWLRTELYNDKDFKHWVMMNLFREEGLSFKK